jgi:hypothetical protein
VSTHTDVGAALVAFHADADELDLHLNRAGHTNKYLDLDKAMEQIRPALAKHGLFVRNYIDWREGPGWVVGAVVEHGASSTSRDSGPYPLVPTKGDAQGHGAGLTYGRRYTIMAVLALVGDPDTDGAPAPRGRGKAEPEGPITARQRSDLMAAIRSKKLPTDKAQGIVQRVAGVDNSADIPRSKFAEVLQAVNAA